MKKRGLFESKKHYEIRKKISEALYIYVYCRPAPLLTKVTQNISTITIIRTNSFESLNIPEEKFKKIMKKYFNFEFFRYVMNNVGTRRDIMYISLTKPLYYEIISGSSNFSNMHMLVLAQNAESLKNFIKKSLLLSYSFWNTDELTHQRRDIVILPVGRNTKKFLEQYSFYYPDLSNEILLLLEVE